jgi:hypothetical protein
MIGGKLQQLDDSNSEEGFEPGADLYLYGEGERVKQDVIIFRDRVFWPCDVETSAKLEAETAAETKKWCFETSVLIMTDPPVIKTPGRADEHLDPEGRLVQLTVNYYDDGFYADIPAMRYHDRVFWPCCKTWPCGEAFDETLTSPLSISIGPEQGPPKPEWFYHLQACAKCDIALVSFDTAVRCESSRQERLAEGLKTSQYCFGDKNRPPTAEIQLKKSKTWDQDPDPTVQDCLRRIGTASECKG